MPATTSGLVKTVINGLTNKVTIRAAAGIGIVIAAAAGISSLRPAMRVEYPNASGSVSWEAKLNGRVYQSGGLLINLGGATGTGSVDPTQALEVRGAMSGISLTVSGLNAGDCDVKSTNGVLSCGTDATGGQAAGIVDHYVRTQGDTMTGGLLIVSGNSSATIDAGLLLEMGGTGSGRILHAQDVLRSSGSLIVDGSSVIFGNAAFTTCADLETVANVLTCGTDDDVPESGDFAAAGDLDADGTITDGVIDKADLSVSTDFGEISTDGSSNVTIDANTVALTTDTTGNYAAGDAEAGAALTGDTATSFFSTGTLELTVGGTGFGSCTDGGMVTGNGTSALTCNAILGADEIYVGDGTTEPTARTLPSCSDGTTSKLLYNSATDTFSCGTDQTGGGAAGIVDYYVRTQGDTMTGGLLIVSGGAGAQTIDAGLLLEVAGAASGRVLHAQDSLRSSGSLLVEGASTLQGAATLTSTLNVTGLATLTDDLTINGGNVNFGVGTTIGDGGDALIINSNGTLTVQDALDVSDNNITNVGDIALDSLTSDAATSISVNLGADAGDDFIVDTNVLVVEGDNNRVGIGTATPGSKLDVAGGDVNLTTGNIFVPNGAAVKFNGNDNNWTMGRGLGGITESMVTSNSLEIFAHNGANEGFVVGANGGNSYMEIRGSDQQVYFRGEVGVGTINADSKLQVSGGGGCFGSDANCNTDNNTEGVVYSSATSMTLYDLAERYPTKDKSLTGSVLLALDPANGVYVKRAERGDRRLIGVHSMSPAIDLGGFNGDQFKHEKNVAVALKGRVPVSVVTENGSITVGDPLTVSSTPGVAMRARPGDQIVGYALEDYLGKGVGSVLVFIELDELPASSAPAAPAAQHTSPWPFVAITTAGALVLTRFPRHP